MAKKKISIDSKKLKRVLRRKFKEISEFAVEENADIRLELIQKNLKKSKDTGELVKSFKVKSKKKKAFIFSKASYAAIQNYGGRIKLTKKMRGKMWALFYKTKNDMYKAIALTKKKYITIKPKDYLKISKRKVNRELDKRLSKFIKKQNKR